MADVSNLKVCDPSIKNGDIAYVNDQADTGYTGYVTFIDVKDMQFDAKHSNECEAIVSQWVANHPWANGIYWNLNNNSGSSGAGSVATPQTVQAQAQTQTQASSTTQSTTNALSNVLASIKKYWEWILIAFLLLILIAYFLMPKKKTS